MRLIIVQRRLHLFNSGDNSLGLVNHVILFRRDQSDLVV